MGNIKETKIYNINDFLNWYERDELEISPKYQRNPVWNLKAKSYLIDTVIRGFPISQIQNGGYRIFVKPDNCDY